MNRREDGAATIEFIWLALILMVPLVYIMISVFEVQRTSFGATAASRAAARTFVLAPDPASGHERAQSVARVTLDDHGVGEADVIIDCEPACHQPGSSVRVRVEVRQPLPLAPRIFGDQVAAIDVDATHRAPYGRYRGGP